MLPIILFGLGVYLLLGTGRKEASVPAPPSPTPPKPPSGPSGPPPPSGTRLLRFGVTGDDVAAWQTFLGVAATGTFDTATVNATKTFQASRGLTADGIVGAKTRAAASQGPTSKPPAPAPSTPKPPLASAVTSTVGPPIASPITGGGSGHAFARSLPANAGEAREALILAAVRKGMVRVLWTNIIHEEKGHTLKLPVMADALAIGDANDFVRVNVNMRTQQAIADFLGANLITSKISDIIWRSAVVKLPFQGLVSGSADFAKMATTEWMVRQSDLVEKRRQAAGMSGLLADAGKDWVLSVRLIEPGPWPDGKSRPPPQTRAANYGGHKADGTVFQPVGIVHDFLHTDYSQVCRLAGNTVEVDGSPMPLADLLKHPELSFLVSNEGPLPFSRHPFLKVAEVPIA